MSRPESQTLPLSNASFRQIGGELVRRVETVLAALPDGSRWTRMDWVFAVIVACLALGSTGFVTATFRVVTLDPNYYFQRSIAALAADPDAATDPIETGAIAATGEDGAMPVPQVHRSVALRPEDYEIVMLFGEEVFLATPAELMRAKVGSVLPGLGAMLSIDPATRSVRFERAVLTALGD